MIDWMQRGWWYWLLNACLLTAGRADYPLGFELAIGPTVIYLVDCAVRGNIVQGLPALPGLATGVAR